MIFTTCSSGRLFGPHAGSKSPSQTLEGPYEPTRQLPSPPTLLQLQAVLVKCSCVSLLWMGCGSNYYGRITVPNLHCPCSPQHPFDRRPREACQTWLPDRGVLSLHKTTGRPSLCGRATLVRSIIQHWDRTILSEWEAVVFDVPGLRYRSPKSVQVAAAVHDAALGRKRRGVPRGEGQSHAPLLSLSPQCIADRGWAKPCSRGCPCDWSRRGLAQLGRLATTSFMLHQSLCSLPSGPPLAAGT